jgi:membrane fusion protein
MKGWLDRPFIFQKASWRGAMSQSLFREGAIDHQRFRIWGEVAIALPNSFALVTGFIALSALAMALFVSSHNYARKEHATGFLVPTEGIARIMPPRSGTITAVHVSEGQHVERDAPLLTVTDTETSDRDENIDVAMLFLGLERRAPVSVSDAIIG